MLPKRTRIGILSPITWPIPPKGYGAWERVVTNLATGLAAAGYKNVVLFATKQAKLRGVKTISVIDKPLSQTKGLGLRAFEFVHMASALKIAADKVDIIHNHFNYHPLLFGQFIKPPIVTTMHGSAVEPESKRGYLQYKRLPFVSISNFERKFLPELNYVRTVYNGIDLKTFRFQPRAKNYLVNAGRIHPTKGVHNAIKLALRLKIPLYLAGPVEPDQIEYFNKQIRPHIDGKRVKYLGNLPHNKLSKLVGEALAFVALTEWQEPFGLSVAEAISCGTPVIAAPLGSHNELIKPGINGILAKSVDEAAKQFSRIVNIDRQACRWSAEQTFSVEAMVNGYLTAYKKVLNN